MRIVVPKSSMTLIWRAVLPALMGTTATPAFCSP